MSNGDQNQQKDDPHPGLKPGEQTEGGTVVPEQPQPQGQPAPQQAPEGQQDVQASGGTEPAGTPPATPEPGAAGQFPQGTQGAQEQVSQGAPTGPQQSQQNQTSQETGLQPGEVFCEECGRVLSANQSPGDQNEHE